MAWLAALGPGAAVPAQAAGSASCALSTTPLAFGRYVPSRNLPSEFTATVHLTCAASGATPAPVVGTIGLIGSAGPSGRELANGPNRLRYQLFLDPARTITWGDGTGGTSTQSVSATVGPTTPLRQSFTIYGRILARQSKAAVGHYSGQITAILNY